MVPRRLAGFVFSVATVVALAGGGASAQAATVTCGQVVDKSITVGNDLPSCPGDGLVAGANGIRIDLGGHTISSGTHAAGSAGVDLAGHDDVQVRNGQLRNFDVGLVADGDRSAITSLKLADVSLGVRVTGDHNAFSRLYLDPAGKGVEETGAVGTRLSGVAPIVGNNTGGFTFTGGGDTQMVDSHLGGDTVVTDEPGDLIADSDILGSVEVVRSGGTAVARNDFGAASNFSVRVNGSTGSSGGVLVAGNTMSYAGRLLNTSPRAGIFIDHSTGDAVRNNRAELGTGSGMVLDGAVGTVASDNILGYSKQTSGGTNGNQGYGIEVRGSTQVQLLRNLANTNGLGGVLVDAASHDTLLSGTLASYNSGTGIDVRDTTATLTKNSASRNTGFGIFAAPGATDGGGNRASANAGGNCSPTLTCGP